MVETRGLIGSVEAADAMVKACERRARRQGVHRRRLRHLYSSAAMSAP
jgi:hypothetical protein